MRSIAQRVPKHMCTNWLNKVIVIKGEDADIYCHIFPFSQ